MSMVKEALRTKETKTNKGRTVAGIVNSIETLEGGGFLVRRPFPKASFSDFDPFLLLDEMGPMDVAPGEAKGAPDHPHRGFETVTYMLSGDMEHKDSSGYAGQLRSGDVQWMTAGSGVVHAEMPSDEFMRTGGVMHGFQLWVNLPLLHALGDGELDRRLTTGIRLALLRHEAGLLGQHADGLELDLRAASRRRGSARAGARAQRAIAAATASVGEVGATLAGR